MSGTSRSIGGPAGPRHPTRKGPAMGPNPVATPGSTGTTPSTLPPHTIIDPEDPSRHVAVFIAAALGRSLAHRAGCNVCISMRGNRVDLATATRRQGPATLRQLCVNSASTVQGAGRAAGRRRSPVLSTGQRSRRNRCGARVIGVPSTLRQLGRGLRATLRQGSKLKIRPCNHPIGCSPSKTLPTISEFRCRQSTRGDTATKAHRGSGSGGTSATDEATSTSGSTTNSGNPML